MATIRKQKITRHYDAAGKECRAADAVRQETRQSRKWYAYGVPGSRGPIPLATDRRVAERMLARLIADGEAALAHLPAPASRLQPLGKLLDAYRTHLSASGNTARYSNAKPRRVERVLVEGLGWTTPRDVAATPLCNWLADQAALHGWSPRTRNELLQDVNSFCRWLVRQGQLASNPTAGLPRWPEGVDLRRDRRPLTPEELQRLLETVRDAPVDRWPGSQARIRMPARDRYHLYLTTVSTGFRAGEVASLTPAHFLLEEQPPVVLLPARIDKRRQAVRQPLPLDVVPILATYLQDRPRDLLIWPGHWAKRAGELLRDDLVAAGIAPCIHSPNGPLWVDFHSLRHTYGALLDRVGCTLKEAMQLMRHSDPRLTMKRYGRAGLAELGRAVAPIVTSIVTCPGAKPGQAEVKTGNEPDGAAAGKKGEKRTGDGKRRGGR